MSEKKYCIVLPTDYGDMIINRFDINQANALIKTRKATDAAKVDFAKMVCADAKPGAIALDIGANFGTYSLAMAKVMSDSGGQVYSFEAQRIIYYMLCGSIVLNGYENCFPQFVCVGDSNEQIDIPKFDYSAVMNFGSIEFGSRQLEPLHQERGPSNEKVEQVRIDDYNFSDVVYMKIDVEGMEASVIRGAATTISECRPVLQVEVIKSDKNEIGRLISQLNYQIYEVEGDFICIPQELSSKYRW